MLAGALVGWAAAVLTISLGRALVARLVAVVSRVSDPVLEHVWARLPQRLVAPRALVGSPVKRHPRTLWQSGWIIGGPEKGQGEFTLLPGLRPRPEGHS